MTARTFESEAMMNFGFSTNRNNIQNNVHTQQQLFKRFKARFNNTTNASERTFLKREISNCCNQLKQCAQQWKTCGYGTTGWITMGYNPVNPSQLRKSAKANRRTARTSRTRKSRRSHVRSSRRTSASRRTRSGSTRRTRRSYAYAY